MVGVILHRRLELAHRLLVLLLPDGEPRQSHARIDGLGRQLELLLQRSARLLDLVVARVDRGQDPVEARHGRLGLHRPLHELDRLAQAILLDERCRLDPGRRHRLGIGLRGDVELGERALHVLLGGPEPTQREAGGNGPLIQLGGLREEVLGGLGIALLGLHLPHEQERLRRLGRQRLGDARRAIGLVDTPREEQRAARARGGIPAPSRRSWRWRPGGRARP